ncbi:MAG: MarR family [Thermoplasmata archaeon]|nr:MarR family [Thermoplasmata archaeon]
MRLAFALIVVGLLPLPALNVSLPVALPAAPTVSLPVALPLPATPNLTLPALPALPLPNATSAPPNASAPNATPRTWAPVGFSFTPPDKRPRDDAPLALASTPTPPPPPRVVALEEGPPTPLRASPVAAAAAMAATVLAAAAGRLYSRFGKGDVRDAAPRARLCELLAERPGATLADLAAWTGESRGKVVHHTHMLARHGLVVSRHDGLHRRFWLAGQQPSAPARPPTAAQRRVLDALAAHGPLTREELARMLGVTPQAVSHLLLKLRGEARVEVADAADGPRRWITSPGAREGATSDAGRDTPTSSRS